MRKIITIEITIKDKEKSKYMKIKWKIGKVIVDITVFVQIVTSLQPTYKTSFMWFLFFHFLLSFSHF